MVRISFYNTKEGVGKTTISSVLANLLVSREELKVGLVDTVKKGNCLSLLRDKHTAPVVKNYADFYRVDSWEDFLGQVEEEQYHCCLFDLSSTDDDKNLDFLLNSDYIFIVSDYESKEDFINDKALGKSFNLVKLNSSFRLKNVYYIFNKVDRDFDASELNVSYLEYPILEEGILKKNNGYIAPSIKNLNFLSSEIRQLVLKENKTVLLETTQLY